MDDSEEQINEKLALESMFENEELQFSELDGQISGSAIVRTFLDKTLIVEEIDQKKYAQYINKLDGKLKLKFLPPIEIQFRLPQNYPSAAPPTYTLICRWLNNEQFNKVCKQLDDIWSDSEGQVVLYRWISYLQNDLLNTLNIRDSIKFVLTKGKLNESAVNFNLPIERVLDYVLNYNAEAIEAEFENSLHDCAICFDCMSGKHAFRFIPCEHAFCNNCVTNYFSVLIDEGNVNNLICPEDKCDSEALPQQVKKCLSDSLYERYERLLLQRAIDTIDNIVFCPRSWCGTPVLFGAEEDYDECPKCHYVFCRMCKKASHGVNPCALDENAMEKIREVYRNGSSTERAALEKQYGSKTIKFIIEELSSKEWLQDNSKKCPNCKAHIQKSSGCNKMQCWKCRKSFCWLCNKVLNSVTPYEHFSDSKSPCYRLLFQGLINDEDDEDDDDDDEDDNLRIGDEGGFEFM